MRNHILLLAAVLLTGCANQQSAMQPVTHQPEHAYAAAALAFDPPITLAQAPIDLSRDNRGQAALVGFEQNNVSYYDVVTYDRESSDRSDRVIQDSVSERIGSIRR